MTDDAFALDPSCCGQIIKILNKAKIYDIKVVLVLLLLHT